MYQQDLYIRCPRSAFEANLYRLRIAAESWGLEMEVLHARAFRNPQRLGVRSKEAIVRLSGTDRNELTEFVAGVHF
ncbi:hypothetical protein IPM09_04250 [Candidatus Saccharibacteria bacterium]|nr:MAG: hypothetical protein IPM09_04250 [Candidatus Saccharibacteria bacterium]